MPPDTEHGDAPQLPTTFHFFAEFVAQIDNGEAPTEEEIDAGIDAAIQCMEEMELCVTR